MRSFSFVLCAVAIATAVPAFAAPLRTDRVAASSASNGQFTASLDVENGHTAAHLGKRMNNAPPLPGNRRLRANALPSHAIAPVAGAVPPPPATGPVPPAAAAPGANPAEGVNFAAARVPANNMRAQGGELVVETGRHRGHPAGGVPPGPPTRLDPNPANDAIPAAAEAPAAANDELSAAPAAANDVISAADEAPVAANHVISAAAEEVPDAAVVAEFYASPKPVAPAKPLSDATVRDVGNIFSKNVPPVSEYPEYPSLMLDAERAIEQQPSKTFFRFW